MLSLHARPGHGGPISRLLMGCKDQLWASLSARMCWQVACSSLLQAPRAPQAFKSYSSYAVRVPAAGYVHCMVAQLHHHPTTYLMPQHLPFFFSLTSFCWRAPHWILLLAKAAGSRFSKYKTSPHLRSREGLLLVFNRPIQLSLDINQIATHTPSK